MYLLYIIKKVQKISSWIDLCKSTKLEKQEYKPKGGIMKRYLKSAILGLGGLGMIFSGGASYAQDLVEYTFIAAIQAVGSTQGRLSSGLRINSAKDDTTGVTMPIVTFTNVSTRSEMKDITVTLRYTDAATGKVYVIQPGMFAQGCYTTPSGIDGYSNISCKVTNQVTSSGSLSR